MELKLDDSSLGMLGKDPILHEIYLNQAMSRRTIEFLTEFDREECYKAIYFMERIERLDDENDILMEQREPIAININSYGGSCYDLMAMASVIHRLKQRGYTIKTHVSGVAMSCGFLLTILGSKGHRSMGKYTTIMCHQHSSMAYGEYQTMREDIQEQDKLWKTMCDLIKDYTNITQEQLNNMRNRKFDWYMNADEAIELGCVDYIY